MRIKNPLMGSVGRFVMTVAAIGACTLMMVFLWSTYQSVNSGAVDYIRRTRADIWMLQSNATNIIRGSSIMTQEDGLTVLDTKVVASASPVLLLLSSVKLHGRFFTLFLTGYQRGCRGVALDLPPSPVQHRVGIPRADVPVIGGIAQAVALTWN